MELDTHVEPEQYTILVRRPSVLDEKEVKVGLNLAVFIGVGGDVAGIEV